MTLTGEWDKAGRMLGQLAEAQRWQAAWERAATAEAHRLRGLMVMAFQNAGPPGQKWPPLAAITQLLSRIAGRGDRHPLLYHGDLRNSIQVVRERDVVFVGTHRATKGPDGKSLVNLAMIHNYGTRTYTVRITDKVRRFFLWLSLATGGQTKPLSLGRSFLVIRIPPRPWVEPIWEAEGDNAADNIAKAIVRNMLTPG